MAASFLPVNRRTLLTAGALSLLALVSTSAMAAAAYVWTEIVVPNAMVLSGFGPNNLGQVAITNSDGTTGIYRLGSIRPLPAPPAGYKVVAAGGINDTGVIVGSATTTADPSHDQAFILANGQYRFFSRSGWQNTDARGIGPSGLVVGISSQDDFAISGAIAGFVYDPSTGNFTDVTPVGSFYTIVQGINKFGRISGSGQDDSLGRYAFIWQLSTLTRDDRKLVPFLDRIRIADGFANARGINDEGVITGWGHSNGQTVGFVGSSSRGYELVVPPGGDAAGASSFCQGINNARQVACVVQDPAGNSRDFVGSPEE
jgi:hypothetical protein